MQTDENGPQGHETGRDDSGPIQAPKTAPRPDTRAATALERRRDRAHEYQRRRYATDPEYRAARNAARSARKKRKTATDPNYRAKHNAKRNANKRRQYHADANHRTKALARATARYAIRTGKLARQPCEICGQQPAEAHHDDYSEPLSVRWLCSHHHREHHRQARMDCLAGTGNTDSNNTCSDLEHGTADSTR